MSRKPSGKADPLEVEIELALNPGAFIPDRACFSFAIDLGGVAAKISKLAITDPARAMALYEAFLAGCYEKAEELDDSSGSFGQFVGELFCGWIEARQAAGADPDETATRLLAWMDHDPYGFCYQLERDAAKAFDRPGRAAFEKQIRARFDAAAKAKPAPDGLSRDRPENLRRRWGEVLRTLYLQQKNVAAYIALAEETGPTPQDCHAVATLLAARRKPEEALPWIDRGIDLDKKVPHGSMAADDLARLKRELLTRLGRGDEALEAAWAEYCEHPSTYSYGDLMKFVPKARRAAWHRKAIDAAKGTDLHSLIELLLETKEIERLAELVRRIRDEALEKVSHHATEPAAQTLEKPHPDLAARLWRAQGMRIVNAKKSRHYDAALSNLERAMRCYEKAGLTAEWKKTVDRVRAEHHRKTGFMSGFEGLVAGSGPSDRPSFLERARARWGKRLEAEDR
jgi:tetratricopeptide (TPR) repeat protein